MQVRPPAVAGMFYPGSQAKLLHMVDQMLARVAAPGPAPKAMVLPHAGYRYSGSTAAQGYATLPAAAGTITRVVLLGPCHRVGVPAIALPDAEAFATPLGQVPVWTEGAQRLSGFDQVVNSPEAHAEEHSLEVHLPFLQHTLPDAQVLPLAVGWVTPTEVAEVLDAVWGGPETLVVVSSDLSHYLPYAQAQTADQATLRQIENLGPALDHDQACGATPVNGLMVAAGQRHLVPTVVSQCNSGDTSFDRSRVVGYAFVRFDQPGDFDA